MSMFINNNISIEVADSDVSYNRRLLNSRANSLSETSSYYINDDKEKYDEILTWFNNFSENNKFYIDVLKTKQYLVLLERTIIPNKNQFKENLEGIEISLSNFSLRFTKDFEAIPKLSKTGTNYRYLKFENGDDLVRIFRDLILGRLTNIVIIKKGDSFFIHLELIKGYFKFLELEPKTEDFERVERKVSGGFNKIYYGTPGSGKSHYVQSLFEKQNNIVHRTTFYPEYSNADFVGQILPKLSSNELEYEFNPGVFSLAFKDAISNPDKKVVLIIEEVNRGNAPAIFGDIFQLLDRNEFGKSKYQVKMPQVEKWLQSLGKTINTISFPENLFLIGTMNTSDQNIFTLDTAFKRRWNLEYISNEFDDKPYLTWFDWFVPGSKITWKKFVRTINNKIKEDQSFGVSIEDKRIGIYFVGQNELLEPTKAVDIKAQDVAKAFAYKVLMYIWEDVAKLNRDYWFDNINSLEDVLKMFLEYGKEESNIGSLKIFKDLF